MTRPPGEGRARTWPTDTVPWGGFRERQGLPPAPDAETWVKRVATPATPVRELDGDRFVGWIDPDSRRGAA